MPIILGIVFIGGILILLVKGNEDSEESKELKDKNTNTPSGVEVNVEEIRRLRRELRHQLAIKKKNSPGKPPSSEE